MGSDYGVFKIIWSARVANDQKKCVPNFRPIGSLKVGSLHENNIQSSITSVKLTQKYIWAILIIIFILNLKKIFTAILEIILWNLQLEFL